MNSLANRTWLIRFALISILLDRTAYVHPLITEDNISSKRMKISTGTHRTIVVTGSHRTVISDATRRSTIPSLFRLLSDRVISELRNVRSNLRLVNDDRCREELSLRHVAKIDIALIPREKRPLLVARPLGSRIEIGTVATWTSLGEFPAVPGAHVWITAF